MFSNTSAGPADTPLPPCIVVHDLAQAQAALAPGLPVTLLSAPGAGVWAGAGWWRALVDAAAGPHCATPMHDILDCAAAAGRAMAALRLGQRILVLDPACPGFARIASIGAIVLARRPPSLDIAGHSAARLAAWLRAAR